MDDKSRRFIFIEFKSHKRGYKLYGCVNREVIVIKMCNLLKMTCDCSLYDTTHPNVSVEEFVEDIHVHDASPQRTPDSKLSTLKASAPVD